MKFLVAILVLLSVADAQYLPTIKGSELRTILKSDSESADAVKCIINFTPNCNPELQKAAQAAPEIFRSGGKCESCTDRDAKVLRNFLGGLQKKHPSEYKKLIQGLTDNQ